MGLITSARASTWTSLATSTPPIRALTSGLTLRRSRWHSHGLSGMLRGTSPICVLRITGTWDLSIQKYFPVRESVRFQFRLDMFNAFNHVNFYKPNTFMGGGFGTINAAWGPRLMQAALKLYW